MLLSRIINKCFDIEERISSSIILLCLVAKGLKLGKGIRMVGWPSVHRKQRSIISIGNGCVLRSRSRNNAIGVNHRIILRSQHPDAELIIGNHVGISGGAICSRKRIIIGDYCLIGSNVIIADNDFHPIAPEGRRYRHLRNDSNDIPAKDIIIGPNVWIGADAYILKGVTIGENSVIGAMSVVSKSIPANCVAAGNPARFVKELR